MPFRIVPCLVHTSAAFVVSASDGDTAGADVPGTGDGCKIDDESSKSQLQIINRTNP